MRTWKRCRRICSTSIVGFALAAVLIVCGLLYGPGDTPGKADGISSAAIAAYLLAATVLTIASRHDPAAFTIFTLLTALTVAIAWRTDAALWALPAAGVMTIAVMIHWAAPNYIDPLIMPAGVTQRRHSRPAHRNRRASGGRRAARRPVRLVGFCASRAAARMRAIALTWSATAVVAPIAILIALYLRIAEFDRSIPFAGLALLMAALYGYATELLNKRPPQPGVAASAAVFATGAVAALALTLTFALDKGWLTVALALMVPGIAWVVAAAAAAGAASACRRRGGAGAAAHRL